MNDMETLASLAPPADWTPNSSRAFAKLQARQVSHRTWNRRGLLAAAGAVTVLVTLMAVPLQTACAQCVRPLPKRTTTPQPATVTSILPVPLPAPPKPVLAKATETKSAAPAVLNFKQSGSPTAPIACEVYTDYECPACADLYNQTMPEFITQFVKTGKVRLLHRDLPLPQHRYAQLAARYANAAGALGLYDIAVQQIFRTQQVWKQDGNVDAQLALVLAPGVMQTVRSRVQSDDPELNTTIATDMSAAMSDRINQTPTIVVVANGKRTPIAGYTPFATLKAYLDELAGK